MRKRTNMSRKQTICRLPRQNLLSNPRPVSTDTPISSPLGGAAAENESAQSGKRQRVLEDLKVATLKIPEELRKQLIEVVRENVDAFAASPTYLGITSLVIHTIKTGNAHPFLHKLRPISLARRQYLEQEVDKLISTGAVSPEDPGACP